MAMTLWPWEKSLLKALGPNEPGPEFWRDDELEDDDEEGFCKELEKELGNFLDDPMTEAYGAQDCSALIVKAHKKRCPKCRAKEERR